MNSGRKPPTNTVRWLKPAFGAFAHVKPRGRQLTPAPGGIAP